MVRWTSFKTDDLGAPWTLGASNFGVNEIISIGNFLVGSVKEPYSEICEFKPYSEISKILGCGRNGSLDILVHS